MGTSQRLLHARRKLRRLRSNPVGADNDVIAADLGLRCHGEGHEVGHLAPQLRELIGYQRTAAALGEHAAAANLASVAPEEDQDVVAAALRRAFGRTINPLALGRQV